MIVGHEDTLRRLHSDLPPVSLFLGPASVGKWTTAEHLRREYGVRDGDLLRIRSLTMDEARTASKFMLTSPLGDLRFAIIRLDSATPASLHALLKALEEIPSSSRVVLVSTESPMETIVSRSEIFHFSLLSQEQVERVLIQRKLSPSEARRYAELAGGQVGRALSFVSGMEGKATVLAAVNAIRERNPVSLDSLAVKWTDEHTNLLATLCREIITGRWRIFMEAEVEGIGRKLPLKILTALHADIRPRLVVRSSLMSVLKEAT